MHYWFSPRSRLRLAWLCVFVHVCALLASLTLLANGMPPGDLLARREYVATHATLWSLGWLIWLPATLTLVLFFMAWADALAPMPSPSHVAEERDRGGGAISSPAQRGRAGMGVSPWALLAIALTLAGGIVDWVDETTWIFLAPQWAMLARTDAFYANLYAVWDRAYFVFSIGLANLGYTLGGLILNAVAYRTPSYPRWLARFGAVVWSLSVVLTVEGWANDGLGVLLLTAAVFAVFLPSLLLVGYGWLIGAQPTAREWGARLSFREVVRSIIPKHPIPMQTVFRECFLVNFAMQPETLCRLLPGPIVPDMHNGEAFISIVIANMDSMRPASAHVAVPKLFGVTYNQIVYRAVVRYIGDAALRGGTAGERGVHFLRSDADNRLMSLLGDWLTFFRFHYARMSSRREGQRLLFDVYAPREQHADIHATFDTGSASHELPRGSTFASLDEAKEFLVQLFAAFAYDDFTQQVSTVRITRGEWDIAVVEDALALYEFMDGSKLFPKGSTRLDSIFYVRELPYHWHTLERNE